MKIPKRPTDTWEYTPKDLTGVTVTLKPLSCEEFDRCTSLMLKKEEPSALRAAAYAGVKDWTGFDEEFSLDNLKLCDDSFIYELGGAVLQGAQITETEKN